MNTKSGIKTDRLLVGVVTGLALTLVVTSAHAQGKGKGNNSTSAIELAVNDQCEIVVSSEKPISNIIYNLGGDEEEKIEYIYTTHPDGSMTNEPIGHEFPIGNYNFGHPTFKYDSVHVKAGNNGKRGVGTQEYPTDSLNLGTIPAVCEQVTYAIGDTGPGGGIVFYVDPDSNGMSGLEAAPVDQSAGVIWCNSFVDIGGIENLSFDFSNPDDNSGSHNTPLIADEATCGTGSAAGVAQAYTGPDAENPSTGWFLPNREELNMMYTNIGPGCTDVSIGCPLGGLGSGFYWSSSEFGNFDAWIQFFVIDVQASSSKEGTFRVRAVRAFNNLAL